VKRLSEQLVFYETLFVMGNSASKRRYSRGISIASAMGRLRAGSLAQIAVLCSVFERENRKVP